MNMVAEMLLAEPKPFVIWATLLLLTVPAMLVLGSPHGLRAPGSAIGGLLAAFGWRPEPVADPVAEAEHVVRFADEMKVAADRAAVSAERWQERWHQAEQDQAVAWEAWLAAETRLRDSLAGAVFGTPWSVRTCEEYAARERFLHRSVAEAADRGDLPATAVADALAGLQGWDAKLHPLEQELAINRAAAAYRRQQYEMAAVAERAAWHDTETARRASVSLRMEEAVAAARSAEIGHLVAKRPARTALAPSRRLVTAAAA
jgi:hypothetical protein